MTRPAPEQLKAVLAEIDRLTADTTAEGARGEGDSWDSTGRSKPASAALVARLLPNHEGPVCLGTLELVANLGADQWNSDEGVWGDDGIITSSNREALGHADAPAIHRPT